MRKRFFLAAIGIVVLAGLARTTVASSDFDGSRLRMNLRGFQEVPSVSTVARGSFRALVSEDGKSIDWTLSYRNLEAAVQQAHIHFGQTRVNGGITVFLCTNTGNGPRESGLPESRLPSRERSQRPTSARTSRPR